MRLEPVHYYWAGNEVRENICTEIGDPIPPHVHDFAHGSLVGRGRFWMRRGLSEASCRAAEPELIGSAAMLGGAFPSRLEIPAGMWHAFEAAALENGCASLLCFWPGGVK